MKSNKNITIFNCILLKKFINHLMIKGKRQKIERIIYSVFSTIKTTYQISGLLFLYECISILLPPFLLVPIKLSGRVIFIPTILLRHKGQIIAMHELSKSIKLSKKINPNQKFEGLVLETLLLIVLEQQNTAIEKKNQKAVIAFANRKFVHYRW
jgi:small subunit ribosomal protein S7